MYHVPLGLQCIYGRSDEIGENEDGRRGVRFQEEGRVWKLPGLLYADDLVFLWRVGGRPEGNQWRDVLLSCVEEV